MRIPVPLMNAVAVRAMEAELFAAGTAPMALMDRAAARCCDHLLGAFSAATVYTIIVGMGNNGGDGLAIAHTLHGLGRSVEVFRVRHRVESTPEWTEQAHRCMDAGVPLHDGLPSGPLTEGVVIDALIGIGLNGPLTGMLAEAVAWINAQNVPVVAIDLPSGMVAEGAPWTMEAPVVRAERTLTFFAPKPAMALAAHRALCGAIHVLPLAEMGGLPIGADGFVLDAQWARGLLPERPAAGHKGSFGHVAVMAGSSGMAGAAVLATGGALRSAAGVVSALVPQDHQMAILARWPSALVRSDTMDLANKAFRDVRWQAVVAGPGWGTEEEPRALLKRLLQDPPAPLILDADALNILALKRTWQAFLPADTVLTPHPKELDRLCADTAADLQRLTNARELARTTRSVVVLKGHPTLICTPGGRYWMNTTGNAGMAKGGSGDVLAGLIAGLRAQGLSAEAAACLGVYIHGAAGDLAAAVKGQRGMLPTDLIEAIPAAWQALEGA